LFKRFTPLPILMAVEQNTNIWSYDSYEDIVIITEDNFWNEQFTLVC